MTDILVNRRDLEFLLYEWLNVDELFQRERYADHSRDSVEQMIDMAAKLAESEFLPLYKLADRSEPRLTENGVEILPEAHHALRALSESGIISGPFPPELGGLGLPQTIYSSIVSFFDAANVALAGYAFLTVGNARLLAAHGTPEQIETFVKPEIEGRWYGTMCLSEPQAGSSLADIRTRAEPDGEDQFGRRFRLTGNKMWISGGDQDASENIVHLVLAKVPDEAGKLVPGTKGISLFIVPKVLPDGAGGLGQRNDVEVAGLNHKMGFRGTSNCLLNFGEGARHTPDGKAGAIGWLVGDIGGGLPAMFHMMNEARIGVGLGSTMLGYRGYLHALQYAKERPQGRSLANGDVAAPPVPIIEHPDVKRMLLAQKAYVEGALALCLYCARQVDESRSAPDKAAREEALRLLGLLTPIVKTWPSEWALAANDLAIQVHGGYGYTRDFDVEQLYRDNRLNPIHEGTTGIQAMDLLGRKLVKDRAETLGLLRKRIAKTVAAAAGDEQLKDYGEQLDRAWDNIEQVTRQLMGANDTLRVLHNATPFQSAFGHAVVAWLWLDKAVTARKAQGGDDDYYTGKLRACRYFYEVELPKVATHLAFVASESDVASAMPEAAF